MVYMKVFLAFLELVYACYVALEQPWNMQVT